MSGEEGFKSFGFDEIELDLFNYAFARGIDERGKIQTDLRGGNLSFVINALPTPILLEWALRSNKYFSGIVHYRDEMGHSKGRVMFTNAACVQMKMIYESTGQSYISVQCGLQAEMMTVSGRNFFNKWTNESEMSTNSETTVGKAKALAKDAVLNLLDLNDEVSVSGYLQLFGSDYELSGFEVEFVQEVDFKGQPQRRTRGGLIALSLFKLPDDSIHKWLIGCDGQDGVILFGDKMRGYELKIALKEAKCIGCYVETCNSSDINVVTRLNIASPSLKFNDIPFEKNY